MGNWAKAAIIAFLKWAISFFLFLKSKTSDLISTYIVAMTFDKVRLSCSVVSDSLPPHGLQHTRLPCPSPSPRVCSNSCPWSQWCHPTISSSVIPFSFCLQSFPTSGFFPMVSYSCQVAKVFIGVSASASVLPMNIEGWFPLELNGLISLQCKRFGV